ncbi:hypothetical protein [Streptomyces sp. NPDC047928]|uniref:hypothetical protein n=1 Tax=unclassified Streptomyces TaxID=2593676 RepID=UPI00371722D5
MSEQTPSQAEGERDEDVGRPDFPRTTPSQAEGERRAEDDRPDRTGGPGRTAPERKGDDAPGPWRAPEAGEERHR